MRSPLGHPVLDLALVLLLHPLRAYWAKVADAADICAAGRAHTIHGEARGVLRGWSEQRCGPPGQAVRAPCQSRIPHKQDATAASCRDLNSAGLHAARRVRVRGQQPASHSQPASQPTIKPAPLYAPTWRPSPLLPGLMGSGSPRCLRCSSALSPAVQRSEQASCRVEAC